MSRGGASALSLCYALNLLAEHPLQQRRLYEEVAPTAPFTTFDECQRPGVSQEHSVINGKHTGIGELKRRSVQSPSVRGTQCCFAHLDAELAGRV